MPRLHKTTAEVKNMTNDGTQASERSCLKGKEKSCKKEKKKWEKEFERRGKKG